MLELERNLPYIAISIKELHNCCRYNFTSLTPFESTVLMPTYFDCSAPGCIQEEISNNRSLSVMYTCTGSMQTSWSQMWIIGCSTDNVVPFREYNYTLHCCHQVGLNHISSYYEGMAHIAENTIITTLPAHVYSH